MIRSLIGSLLWHDCCFSWYLCTGRDDQRKSCSKYLPTKFASRLGRPVPSSPKSRRQTVPQFMLKSVDIGMYGGGIGDFHKSKSFLWKRDTEEFWGMDSSTLLDQSQSVS
jgi:hypothetical protein